MVILFQNDRFRITAISLHSTYLQTIWHYLTLLIIKEHVYCISIKIIIKLLTLTDAITKLYICDVMPSDIIIIVLTHPCSMYVYHINYNRINILFFDQISGVISAFLRTKGNDWYHVFISVHIQKDICHVIIKIIFIGREQ